MKIISSFIALCILELPAAAQLSGERHYPSTYVSLNYWSKYIRNGFELNGGNSMVQPSVGVELPLGFSIGVSGLFGVRQRQLDEIDAGLWFQKALAPGKLDVSIGFVNYQYWNGQTGETVKEGAFPNNHEIRFGMTFRERRVDVTLGYGVGLWNGTGSVAGISINKDTDFLLTTLHSSLSLTYLDQPGIPGKITEVGFRNSLPFGVGAVTLEPHVSLAYVPFPRLLNGNDQDLIFFWGVRVSIEL